MTPKEWDRKVDFITESLARLAAAQEQDRQDRLDFERYSREMDARLARLLEQQTQLMAHQSERIDQIENRMDQIDKRMDQIDKRMERTENLHENWLRQNQDFQRQALRLLNLILDRLPPLSASPN